MQEYFLKGDWYMLERVIHNIKGVSANLNVHDVFEEAEVFDNLLKSNNIINASSHVEKMIDLISKAEIEITKFFSERGYAL